MPPRTQSRTQPTGGKPANPAKPLPRGTLAEEKAYARLKQAFAIANVAELYISNPRRSGRSAAELLDDDAKGLQKLRRTAARVALRCGKLRREEAVRWARGVAEQGKDRSSLLAVAASRPPTDEQLYQACRFTDPLPLSGYHHRLRFVPNIVNVVSLATVIPSPGTSTRVPLDLTHIATRCTGAYFAPRRFAAVQLAKIPRARVLVFSGQDRPVHLVAIGASGVVSSLLALMQARKQLADEAGVFIDIGEYRTINMVGATDIGATINTEALAQANTDTVHFDPASFVGATMRARDAKGVVIEVYSTGRANIPGARSHNDLLTGFAELLPELLRFSSVGSGASDAAGPSAAAGAPAREAREEAAPAVGRLVASDADPAAALQAIVGVPVGELGDDLFDGWGVGSLGM